MLRAITQQKEAAAPPPRPAVPLRPLPPAGRRASGSTADVATAAPVAPQQHAPHSSSSFRRQRPSATLAPRRIRPLGVRHLFRRVPRRRRQPSWLRQYAPSVRRQRSDSPGCARAPSVPPVRHVLRRHALCPPAPPQPPAPRMIVPQTGPRPVYKARRQPCRRQPSQSAMGAMRPAPGTSCARASRFSSVRAPGPGGAGGRVRRCVPGNAGRCIRRGSRLRARVRLALAQALPPPGPVRPGSRPGGPARRPGQRYVPRGVKEGPMKGYTPPPRMVVSNEPLPITRNITITEGISVKDLAEKLDVRAKDLISRLLGARRFRHHQPDARRRTGQRNGALLRR